MEAGIRKQIVAGVLGHVDAGKSTLAESMLYLSGSIRKLGRIDHRDAHLDTDDLEREHGITIFLKQAVFAWKDRKITLIDTPGHVDFSADMERSLLVLDYAVLLVSASDKLASHTVAIWRLLASYGIPTFLFINKLDQKGTDKGEILKEIKKELSGLCIDFDSFDLSQAARETCLEALALCDERLLEEYLKKGSISSASIRQAILERKIFPCYSGSALKLSGVQNFMDGFCRYTVPKKYPNEFGARAYQVFRDAQDERLTCLKVTGGTLRVKDTLAGKNEKINQIRVYSGAKYETVPEAFAGMVCAVTGPVSTYPGQSFGKDLKNLRTVSQPVFRYRLILPKGTDVPKIYSNLKTLEQEEPELHVIWEEAEGAISLGLMGEVQADILASLIYRRFGVHVEFTDGKIVYQETIKASVEGVGHFESARHFAEVRLLLEPAQRGSGLIFASDVSEEMLDKSWQRVILGHLKEKEHKGVLTGSLITDMKITLIAAKADKFRTDSGDFRQATCRAVRQGLMKAKSILLEPWDDFCLEMPAEQIGRAMADIQKMQGRFSSPLREGGNAVLFGAGPVAKMRAYQKEFFSYTKGRGRISLTAKGYEPCLDQQEKVKESGYDANLDSDNPSASIFYLHGTAFVAQWEEAEKYMQLESPFKDKRGTAPEKGFQKPLSAGPIHLTKEELDEIDRKGLEHIQRNFKISKDIIKNKNEIHPEKETEGKRRLYRGQKGHYLLVDGYNIIFAWEELEKLAEENIGSARDRLADILSNYQAYRGCSVILVFDAYKVEGNPGRRFRYQNIDVVYTKEDETADQYIEKTARDMKGKVDLTVATSDALEQALIMGQGAYRMSAADLISEIKRTKNEIQEDILQNSDKRRNYFFDQTGGRSVDKTKVCSGIQTEE